MNSSLYDCHSCNKSCTNESSTSDSSISNNYCSSNNNNNCNYMNSSNISINNIDNVNIILKSLENDLCDMKVTLAETKATLIFLAQTLCNQGNLCSIEKTLLLNIEQSLKNLNCKLNESKCNVDRLNNIL